MVKLCLNSFMRDKNRRINKLKAIDHFPSPKEFLKARRPERFSDSIIESKPILDRSLLEYHLETLTNRGQEKVFERFAYLLAKKEICPNILPQTGPTGGATCRRNTSKNTKRRTANGCPPCSYAC